MFIYVTKNKKTNNHFLPSSMQECPVLDLCQGIDLEDLPLNFNASDDMIGCSTLDHTKCYQYNENSLKVYFFFFLSFWFFCQSIPYKLMNLVSRKLITLLPQEEKNIGLPPSLLLPAALSVNVVPSLSSISMSNMTGESNANDFQDCGISSGFSIGDSPWESNIEVSFSPKSRDEAKKRYKQKKSKRT